MKIKSGFFQYVELIELAEQKIEELDQLFKKSSLPEETDYQGINESIFDYKTGINLR